MLLCFSRWIRIPLAAVVAGFVLMVAFPTLCEAADPPPSFNLSVIDSRLDLEAVDAPLGDILAAIAAKLSLSLRVAEPITELVSCRLQSVSLDQVLQVLLGNWNHALIYKKVTNDREVPDTLWVTSRNPHRQTVDIVREAPVLLAEKDDGQPPQKHLKKYKKEDIAAVFADSDRVLRDVSARSLEGGEFGDAEISILPNEEEPRYGIRITRLAEASPIRMLGLREGDIVRDVNGIAINSPADFVHALALPPEGGVSVFRIERWRDGHVDPLYLELH